MSWLTALAPFAAQGSRLEPWLERVRTVARTPLLEVAGTEITLEKLAWSLLFLGFTLAVSLVVRRAVARAFRARGVTDEGTVGVPQRLLHYAILIVGVTIILHNLGLNLSTLFAAGAVFAIAIGFAFQTIMQNFVSGVILLVERAIKPGDVLSIDGSMARVVHMGLRSTVVRTLDAEELIVPNSNLVQSTVQNYTLRDSLMRLRAPVGVSYSSDVERVFEVLEEAAASVPEQAQGHRPVVLLTQFGNSSIDFEVSIWIDQPWHQRRIRSELNHTIWRALRQAGLVIAFPQLDVHFDEQLMERLERRGGRPQPRAAGFDADSEEERHLDG